MCRLADDTQVRVPLALTEGFDAYEVGVRPEKIRLHELTDAVPDGQNQMLGTIVDASYLGVSTSYIVEARGGGMITVYEQNVERATRAELWEPGEEVRMTWSPDHTFAVQGGGTPPPDVPVAAGLGEDGGTPVPPPAGVSRRKFLVGGVVAVAAVGVVAFLANSQGGGTTPPRRRVPRRPRPRRGADTGRQRRAGRLSRPRDRRAPVGELDRLHRYR